MDLRTFAEKAEITKKTEVFRACLLAFYFLKREGVGDFTTLLIADWHRELNLPVPNLYRLRKNLAACREAIRGSTPDSFRLHRNFLLDQENKFPELNVQSQAISDHGSVLPEVLYSGTPGYIQSLAKQINASFEWNIFDGCAVLMRRIEEVLLILSYEKLGIADSIKDGNGNYFLLEGIVKNAIGNSQLNLSRNSKRSIEVFRELGNYSAHKITYTCKREYIDEKRDGFRALIDELLHKAGLKT